MVSKKYSNYLSVIISEYFNKDIFKDKNKIIQWFMPNLKINMENMFSKLTWILFYETNILRNLNSDKMKEIWNNLVWTCELCKINWAYENWAVL